jgi:hypothetical protein
MNPLGWLRSWIILPALLVVFGCGDSSPELPLAGLKVEFGKHNIPAEMVAGETVLADVTIKNASSRTWPSKPAPSGRNAVNLSYHWLDRKRQVVVFDGLRTPLPRDLNPGESVTLRVAICAPEKAGEHVLHVTLVQEGVAWFSDSDGANFQFRSQSRRHPPPVPRGSSHSGVGRQDIRVGSNANKDSAMLLRDYPLMSRYGVPNCPQFGLGLPRPLEIYPVIHQSNNMANYDLDYGLCGSRRPLLRLLWLSVGYEGAKLQSGI